MIQFMISLIFLFNGHFSETLRFTRFFFNIIGIKQFNIIYKKTEYHSKNLFLFFLVPKIHEH